MPYAPVHGGSITRASVGNAVAAACRALQAKLVELASAAASGPFTGPSSDGIEARDGGIGRKGAPYRSEEHKSELQSLMRISYAVFCLKKKIMRHDLFHLPSYNTYNTTTHTTKTQYTIIQQYERL